MWNQSIQIPSNKGPELEQPLEQELFMYAKYHIEKWNHL